MQDREKIEQNVKESYPPFAKLKSKNFQYAFKIRVSLCMVLQGVWPGEGNLETESASSCKFAVAMKDDMQCVLF